MFLRDALLIKKDIIENVVQVLRYSIASLYYDEALYFTKLLAIFMAGIAMIHNTYYHYYTFMDMA